MSEFDEKLTILAKKFYFLEPGIISDILMQVDKDLPLAIEIISTMIPDLTKGDENNQRGRNNDEHDDDDGSDDDEEEEDEDEQLRAALELSQQEENEKRALLRVVEREEARQIALKESVSAHFI